MFVYILQVLIQRKGKNLVLTRFYFFFYMKNDLFGLFFVCVLRLCSKFNWRTDEKLDKRFRILDIQEEIVY